MSVKRLHNIMSSVCIVINIVLGLYTRNIQLLGVNVCDIQWLYRCSFLCAELRNRQAEFKLNYICDMAVGCNGFLAGYLQAVFGPLLYKVWANSRRSSVYAQPFLRSTWMDRWMSPFLTESKLKVTLLNSLTLLWHGGRNESVSVYIV